MFAISLSVRKRSIISFLENIYDFVTLILSDGFSRRYTSNSIRVFAGFWLLICTLFISLVSGQLWDLLIRGQPIDKINSYQDLYTKPNWKESRIHAPTYYDYHDFILTDKSDMALDFKRRSEFFDVVSMAFSPNPVDKLENMVKTFLESNGVLSIDNLPLHYYKAYFKTDFWTNLTQGIDYHISESSLGIRPYFLLIYGRSNKKLVQNLNLV